MRAARRGGGWGWRISAPAYLSSRFLPTALNGLK